MFTYRDLKQLISEVLEEQAELLTEGGAGGHMRHPFDIADVKSGADLVKKFEQIAKEIQGGNLPDTKIDGTNTSIKVINGEQFVMDRGSGKSIDIEGITVDRLPQRFKPDPRSGREHGMIPAGKNVLGIFNDDFDKIKPELKALGMLDDPTKFFNMEYVKGTTNVLSYDHDFLKIHGVSQFYEKKDRRGIPARPGLERPINKETGKPIKDPSVPVAYDQKVMDGLVEKLNKSAEKYGFKVYSSIPSKATGGFDYSPVMNVSAPVTFSEGNIEEKTLGDRLKAAKNRIGEKVQTADGRKPPAQGKEIYKAVLGASAQDTNADPQRQIPLDKLLASEEDYQKAIDGAVFWHATRLLGNVIMSNMEVDHPAVKGPATEHEGLVLRLSGDDFDTKITGEFILGGEATSFRAAEPEEEKEVKSKNIAIFPGSFKPPHKGHLSIVERAAQDPEVEEIRVIISAPGKDVRSPNITPEKAKLIFEKFIASANIPKPVSVEISLQPSPIGAAYDYITNMAGPNENILLLTSAADASRYPQETLDKEVAKNKNAASITVKGKILKVCRDKGCQTTDSTKGKISATTTRNVVDTYPNVTLEDLSVVIKNMPDSLSLEEKLNIFETLVSDKLTNKFDEKELNSLAQLEEMSMSGGAVGGYSMPAGKRNKRKKRTIYTMKKKLNLEENILKDYLVEKYLDQFKSLLSEQIDDSTVTGMTYVTDAFNTTRANFEKRYSGLGEQDQRTSFLVNFLNKMVHGFIQQDVGEAIAPVMPFDELIEKGIITLDIGRSGAEYAQTALEEKEVNEQEVSLDIEEEPEGLVADEEGEIEFEKEKEDEEKMKAGKVSPDVTDEPLPGTNETGNRAASSYYNLDSKNVYRFYNLIGPEDIDDREQFVEFYFKNIVALAAGIERSKTGGDLPEPLNSMFNKLSGTGDVVREPELEEPETKASPMEEPLMEEKPLSEGDISNIIKQSVIKAFRGLQI